MDNTFLEYVLRADSNETAASRGLLIFKLVYLLVEASKEALIAGTAALSEADISGRNPLRRRLQNTSLPCTEESDKVTIDTPRAQD